jgi:hypothetical protein
MTAIETLMRRASCGLVLLGGIAGWLLAAGPAQAQAAPEVCGNLETTAQDALGFYLDELDSEWTVPIADEGLCKQLTQSFAKACQFAVRDTVRCIQNQIGTLNKQNQIACKGLSQGNAASCIESFTQQAKNAAAAAGNAGKDQAAECSGEAADTYFNVCMLGFPSM